MINIHTLKLLLHEFQKPDTIEGKHIPVSFVSVPTAFFELCDHDQGLQPKQVVLNYHCPLVSAQEVCLCMCVYTYMPVYMHMCVLLHACIHTHTHHKGALGLPTEFYLPIYTGIQPKH